MFKKWWLWAIVGFGLILMVCAVAGILTPSEQVKEEVETLKEEPETQAELGVEEEVVEPEPTPEAVGKPPEKEPAEEIKPEPEIVEPASYTVSGSGKDVSSKMQLEKGLVLFEMRHDGRRNFAVKLLDDQGEWVDLLVNVIGNHDGITALGIEKAGEYLLDIEADGSWEIQVTQPRPATGDAPPLEISGEGQAVSPFLELNSGLTTFRMEHTGERNFAIKLLDSEGNWVDLLVNEIGSFEGSKALGIRRAGLYILDIEADGNWTISIEQ